MEGPHDIKDMDGRSYTAENELVLIQAPRKGEFNLATRGCYGGNNVEGLVKLNKGKAVRGETDWRIKWAQAEEFLPTQSHRCDLAESQDFGV